MTKKIVPFHSSGGTKGVNPDEVTSVETYDCYGHSVIRTSDGQHITVKGTPDEVIEQLNRE
jgi:hypothetical protein